MGQTVRPMQDLGRANHCNFAELFTERIATFGRKVPRNGTGNSTVLVVEKTSLRRLRISADSQGFAAHLPAVTGLGVERDGDCVPDRFATGGVAYLDHEVLRLRLRGATCLLNPIEGRAIDQIFGYPDNLKFRSSITLFASVAADNQLFMDALDKILAPNPTR